MKAQVLSNRIEEYLTGKFKRRYKKAIYLVSGITEEIRPYKGKGIIKCLLSIYISHYTISALNMLGISFKYGNDDLDQKNKGNYIRLTEFGKQQVKDYRKGLNNLLDYTQILILKHRSKEATNNLRIIFENQKYR